MPVPYGQTMIVIVDYGMGNLRSVQKAFEACGAKAKVSAQRSDVEKAQKIVLPGVGAFAPAMRELKRLKLAPAIREKTLSGTPFLGLCLGMQLLFTHSEEGDAKGLDIIPGEVKRFRGALKVPHMGWNTLKIKSRASVLRGVKPGDHFYFVHSYYAVPEENGDIASTTSYGREFCSTVARGNIFATQFHPEKSQRSGLRIIENFAA